MPASHMEVGCPGTWGLELLTPNPGSKSTPKACPTRNPATSPACHAEGSGLIQTGDGGSSPKSHSPQGARPEAPIQVKESLQTPYQLH